MVERLPYLQPRSDRSEITQLAANTGALNTALAEQTLQDAYDALTLDRISTWSNAPAIVGIAGGEDVKCGATCVKFTGRSGLEMKNNMYWAAGVTYKISGWIKTDGTFETGVYGTNGSFTTTESAVITQSANSVNFLIPDTQGEWQFFEFTFKAGNSVSGGAWVNNDRNKTATIAYLDNWHIYDTAFAGNTANVDPEAVGDCPITPVSFVDVSLTDNFGRRVSGAIRMLPYPIALEQCYSTGRVDNFKKAGGLMSGYFNTEYTFDDTDIYKILEGMLYLIQSYPRHAHIHLGDAEIELTQRPIPGKAMWRLR